MNDGARYFSEYIKLDTIVTSSGGMNWECLHNLKGFPAREYGVFCFTAAGFWIDGATVHDELAITVWLQSDYLPIINANVSDIKRNAATDFNATVTEGGIAGITGWDKMNCVMLTPGNMFAKTKQTFDPTLPIGNAFKLFFTFDINSQSFAAGDDLVFSYTFGIKPI